MRGLFEGGRGLDPSSSPAGRSAFEGGDGLLGLGDGALGLRSRLGEGVLADEPEHGGHEEEEPGGDRIASPRGEPDRDHLGQGVEEEDQAEEGDEAGTGQQTGALAQDLGALLDLGLGERDFALDQALDVMGRVGDELADGSLRFRHRGSVLRHGLTLAPGPPPFVADIRRQIDWIAQRRVAVPPRMSPPVSNSEWRRVSLPILLGLLALVPLLSVPLTGFLGRAAGWPIGVIFLGLAGAMVPSAIRVANGDVITWHAAWVPELGLDLALRLDGLSVIFIALALVIGALVFFYSTTYFTKGNQRGFYVIMTGFTFAMVALTVSDSLVLMFLTWELTSLASFLLIARSGHAGEAASMRTMLLTFIGGLALLAAVALIMARTGTSTFSQAIASPVWGSDPAFTGLIAVLVAAAGFSKAAQFPFHLWLPDAMAAATPVSAYLHAAAVVKAALIDMHSTL